MVNLCETSPDSPPSTRSYTCGIAATLSKYFSGRRYSKETLAPSPPPPHYLEAGPIKQLPSEVLTTILSFLNLKELMESASVCKYWHEMSQEFSLLYPLAQNATLSEINNFALSAARVALITPILKASWIRETALMSLTDLINYKKPQIKWLKWLTTDEVSQMAEKFEKMILDKIIDDNDAYDDSQRIITFYMNNSPIQFSSYFLYSLCKAIRTYNKKADQKEKFVGLVLHSKSLNDEKTAILASNLPSLDRLVIYGSFTDKSLIPLTKAITSTMPRQSSITLSSAQHSNKTSIFFDAQMLNHKLKGKLISNLEIQLVAEPS